MSVIECFRSDDNTIVKLGKARGARTVLTLTAPGPGGVAVEVKLTEKEMARLMRAMIARLVGSEDELYG